MKIEKLTENKIRVIINSDELGIRDINLAGIITKSIETDEIFSDILKRAEKEVDFHTEGCKLLIEAFSSLDDIFVFTITKYLPDKDFKKKKLIVKRKSINTAQQQAICCFKNFDTFSEFCKAIKSLHKIDSSKLSKGTSLYYWKNSYYLVVKNIDCLFYSTLSEFGKLISFSSSFEAKLLEHGKIIIKKNAIEVGMKFFAN